MKRSFCHKPISSALCVTLNLDSPPKKEDSVSKHQSETLQILQDNGYKYEKHLARGGFGTTVLAMDKVRGKPVVVKFIKVNTEKKEAVTDCLREIHAMQACSHPYIVSYWAIEY